MSESREQDTRRDFLKAAGTTAGLGVIGMLLGTGTAVAQEININAMGPTPEQMQEFMALPSGPVCMLNLIKFKPGKRDAYLRYGAEVSKIFKGDGTVTLFAGEVGSTLIGGATWDMVAIVQYPDKTALMKMAQSPEYQAIHHHREEGLEGQMNIAVFQRAGLGGDAAQSGDSGAKEARPERPEVTADQLMTRMDTNGDGKIDMEEAPADMKASFGMIDTNADGGIDVGEAEMIANFISNQ